MARMKKIRFPLKMADGAEVRDLEELRTHFDLETVVEYYKSGKLLTWLRDRYFEEEATAVETLNENAPDFQRQLCTIIGVEFTGEEVDLEEVERRRERLAKLREFTDDEEFISHIDQVAFNQEELADLLDENVETVYLCGKSFNIPLSVKNKRYIGVNRPEIIISAKEKVDFEQNKIYFENTFFCEPYAKLMNASATTTATASASIKKNYTIRKKQHKLYSPMLSDYKVDTNGTRYKEVDALFICDLSTHKESLFYVPSPELLENGFTICSTYICGEDAYFSAKVERSCAPLPNDVRAATPSGGCIFKCSISNPKPFLICNNLEFPFIHKLFATPNGTVVITGETIINLLGNIANTFFKYTVTARPLFPASNSLKQQNYCIISSRKQTAKTAKIADQCSFRTSYFSGGYDKMNSINFTKRSDFVVQSSWLNQSNNCAYLLVQTKAISPNENDCIQYLYEFPIEKDTDFHVLKWSFCSDYLSQPKNIYIGSDFLLYFVFNNESSMIELYKRNDLSSQEELLLRDSLNNYSREFVQDNPIFTMREGKVFCRYNEKIQPTYICDIS